MEEIFQEYMRRQPAAIPASFGDNAVSHTKKGRLSPVKETS